MITEKAYAEFFETVNSDDVKHLPVLFNKTASLGWSTSLPIRKQPELPPSNLKNVVRNLLC